MYKYTCAYIYIHVYAYMYIYECELFFMNEFMICHRTKQKKKFCLFNAFK